MKNEEWSLWGGRSPGWGDAVLCLQELLQREQQPQQ